MQIVENIICTCMLLFYFGHIGQPFENRADRLAKIVGKSFGNRFYEFIHKLIQQSAMHYCSSIIDVNIAFTFALICMCGYHSRRLTCMSPSCWPLNIVCYHSCLYFYFY